MGAADALAREEPHQGSAQGGLERAQHHRQLLESEPIQPQTSGFNLNLDVCVMVQVRFEEKDSNDEPINKFVCNVYWASQFHVSGSLKIRRPAIGHTQF